MRLDVTNRLVVFSRCLQRGMGPPVREKQEEGAVLIGFDDLDRFIGPIVGEIALGLESALVRSRIKIPGKPKRRPQETIDGIKLYESIDDVGIVLWQIQATLHDQAVVKTLIIGRHTGTAPKMPFTDMRGVIARIL